MSLLETRLFTAALRCLHRSTETLDQTFHVKVASLVTPSGSAYTALRVACHELKNRLWDGEHLFLELAMVCGTGEIDVRFNPALAEHLLGLNANFTCLNFKDLKFSSPYTYRLLWLLRSYYNPNAAKHQKFVAPIEAIHRWFFSDQRKYTDYARLKRCVIDHAVAELCAAGLHCTATTRKRGNKATHIVFTIPAVQLEKPRMKRASVPATLTQDHSPDVIVNENITSMETDELALGAGPTNLPKIPLQPTSHCTPQTVSTTLNREQLNKTWSELASFQLTSQQATYVVMAVKDNLIAYKKLRACMAQIKHKWEHEGNIHNLGAFTLACLKKSLGIYQVKSKGSAGKVAEHRTHQLHSLTNLLTHNYNMPS